MVKSNLCGQAHHMQSFATKLTDKKPSVDRISQYIC